jgi:spore maturation protein A
MLGICFSVLVIPSVFYAARHGTLGSISLALLDGADKAVEIAVSLVGITALWSGILSVLTGIGALSFVSRLLAPVLARVFPDTYPHGAGAEEITACISANLLGVSNAATPFALRAMEKMGQENGGSSVASRDMITLVLLSASGFSLFPTSVIALRRAAGAIDPTSILLPVWIVSLTGAMLSVVLSRLFGGGNQHG